MRAFCGTSTDPSSTKHLVDLTSLAVVTGALLLYSLVSGRLHGTMVTAPMVFVVAGFVVGAGGLGIASIDVGHAGIHVVAELTLILVLFTDAARIDLGQVRRDHNLPVRMLMIGLPLTIAVGTLVGAAVSGVLVVGGRAVGCVTGTH